MKKISLILLSLSFNLMANETIFFDAPDGTLEICEIPSNPKILSDNDLDDLKKLCRMDFYNLNEKNKAYAICPKLNSTNPAVNIYKVEGTNQMLAKEQAQKNICKDSSLEAKYKQSISCSYYPSIIGYYHLSEFLKGPKVPAAAYRTMSKSEHKKITKVGVAHSKGLINTIWKQFDRWENRSSPSGKIARLFTEDFSQIAGALSDNPKGEKKYTQIMGLRSASGSRCSYEERAKCFKENPKTGYTTLSNSKDINKENYPLSFEDSAKLIQKLKDISEMLIMDHIMAQGDRFGNQHYYDYFFYQTPEGDFDKKKVKKYINDVERKVLVFKKDPTKEIPYKSVATIPVLLMKDNDCGVIKRNVVKDNNLVAGISHLDYDFYKKLFELKDYMQSYEGQSFFLESTHFTEKDLELVKGNLDEVVTTLASRCQKGQLKFDLSFKDFFNGKDLTKEYSCLL